MLKRAAGAGGATELGGDTEGRLQTGARTCGDEAAVQPGETGH